MTGVSQAEFDKLKAELERERDELRDLFKRANEAKRIALYNLSMMGTLAEHYRAERDAAQARAKHFAQCLVDTNKHGDMCAAYSIWVKRGSCNCGYDAAKKYLEAK